MKVALVHDYLNQYGGAERVLEVLMEMFPDAPVYTILHDEEKTLNRFRGRVKKTSFLDFSFARKHHRLFIPLMPLAAQLIDLRNQSYDLIISDTAGYAKGIKYDHKKTRHISYIHTPLRYAWETDSYFKSKIFKAVFKPIFNYLKKWDYKMAQKPDVLIANSRFIADKVKKYYHREAQVIYPPVDTRKFYFEATNQKNKDYYLAVGRLIHYKRFDLIIEAFARLGSPLKIVGDGPEQYKLKIQSEKLKINVEFISFSTDDELRKLYSGAKALIFPQVEDFGLVAAEAQACGTPVIAFAGGGVMEIVENGITGVLFNEQSIDSLIAATREAKKIEFNRTKISQIAQKFSKDNFKKQILQLTEGL